MADRKGAPAYKRGPGRPRALDDVATAAAAERYAAGASLADLAGELGVSTESVRAALERAGVARRAAVRPRALDDHPLTVEELRLVVSEARATGARVTFDRRRRELRVADELIRSLEDWSFLQADLAHRAAA